MIRGLLIDRRSWSMLLGGIILIGRILEAFGFGDNEFVAFIVNPFTVFAIILIIIAIWIYPLLKPHWISVFLIAGAVCVDYIFVYAFYLSG